LATSVYGPEPAVYVPVPVTDVHCTNGSVKVVEHEKSTDD